MVHQDQTRNPEIPDSVLTNRPGMTDELNRELLKLGRETGSQAIQTTPPQDLDRPCLPFLNRVESDAISCVAAARPC
jgi:hypothetical protein